MNNIKKDIRAGDCVCVCVCAHTCDDCFNSDRESLLDIILMQRLNMKKISAL